MKYSSKENKLIIYLIILFCIFGGIYLSTIKLAVKGDGHEYVLQVVSFQNHASFGVTEEDLHQAQREFYNSSGTLEEIYYRDNPMNEYGNARYSNHYGAYSALVMPVKLIVQLFGGYPLWAFPITNFILWVSAVLVEFFFLKGSWKQRFCIIALTIINPVILYVDWTHSEVYLYSFMIIGLVFCYNKSYGRGIFFLSVAAMQNLGILPYAMMVGIELIALRVKAYCETEKSFKLILFVKKEWKKIVPYGLCYIPGIIPIASTYIKFHTISLVKDYALEDKYILHKGLDYIFDLNLGIIPYEPFVLIIFFVMIILGIKKDRLHTIVCAFGFLGMIYIISNQLQINCGMQGMMRYNIWICPVIMFFSIMNFAEFFSDIKEKWLIGLVGVQAIYTAILLIFICVFSAWQGEPLGFAPWTKWIMDRFPEMYNPTHGIFLSRTLHRESYNESEPVVYYDYMGRVRKILLSKEALDVFKSDDWQLLKKDGTLYDKENLKLHYVDEGDYAYINIKEDVFHAEKYELGDIICFAEDSNGIDANKYILSGLSTRESWGTWTEGDRLVATLRNQEEVGKEIHGHIEIAKAFYQPQHVTIYINNKMVYSDIIEESADIHFDFVNENNGLICMYMDIPDAIRHSSVDRKAPDKRVLGIGLLSMEFED